MQSDSGHTLKSVGYIRVKTIDARTMTILQVVDILYFNSYHIIMYYYYVPDVFKLWTTVFL